MWATGAPGCAGADCAPAGCAGTAAAGGCGRGLAARLRRRSPRRCLRGLAAAGEACG